MANRRLPSPLNFGAMPVDAISFTLGHELGYGEVVFSGRAQLHASRKHPDDYSRVLPHVAAIVSDPLFLGDDFKNPGKIEMIGKIPSQGDYLLVAVTVEKDQNQFYNITSIYVLSEKKVEGRRQKGRLHIARKR